VKPSPAVLFGRPHLVQGENQPNLPPAVSGWKLIPGDQTLLPEWIIEGAPGGEWSLKVAAEYRGTDPAQQRALLILTAFRSVDTAAAALRRLVEELEAAYHREAVQAVGVEALSWRRPQPQTGAAGPSYLIWTKPPGQRDEQPAGLLWQCHNVLLNMRFEGLSEEKETIPFTTDLLVALPGRWASQG